MKEKALPAERVSWLTRIRRNHALEHATIHILSQRHYNIRLVGRSDPWGFSLAGEVSTEEVASAIQEAIARFRHGEVELAIHPRCGTNLATSAVLAALSSFVAMGGRTHSRWEKLPRVLLATLGALLVAQPLGLWAQQYITTTSRVDGIRVKRLTCQQRGRVTNHRIELEHR